MNNLKISWLFISTLFFSAMVSSEDNLDKVSKKLSDPTSNIWALFTAFNFSSYGGTDSVGEQYGGSIILEPIMPLPLTEQYQLLLRPNIGLVGAPVPSGAYDSFESKYGLTKMQLPLLLSPKGDSEFGWGLGPTFILPTATGNLADLEGNAWEAGPSILGVWKPEGYLIGALGQYWWNVSDEDEADKKSHAQINVFLIKHLGGGQDLDISPTITYDANREGQKWNVPLGLTYSFMTKMGNTPMKLQFGLEKSVVKNDKYDLDWNFKFNLIPVVNVKMKPLF